MACRARCVGLPDGEHWHGMNGLCGRSAAMAPEPVEGGHSCAANYAAGGLEPHDMATDGSAARPHFVRSREQRALDSRGLAEGGNGDWSPHEGDALAQAAIASGGQPDGTDAGSASSRREAVMSGHGWIIPNANGVKARCGGPGICSVCQQERADLRDSKDRQRAAEAFRGKVGGGGDCAHLRFECRADIGRLSDEDGGPITGYTANIQVKCADCGLAFRFIGLPAGNHFCEPRVSVDGLELRAPLEPAMHERFLPTASYTMPPRGRQ